MVRQRNERPNALESRRAMRAQHNLDIAEECRTCAVRFDRIFCDLPDDALRQLDEIKYTTVLPDDEVVFVEGQEPLGVFIVCAGHVKLFAGSNDGKTLIERVVGPGEVLGLSAVLSSRPLELTAQTLGPCQFQFIKREDFMRFVTEHNDVCLRAAKLMSCAWHDAHEQVRSIALSGSVTERLARVLLAQCVSDGEQVPEGVRIRLLLTHEELAQMIGSSRETVTRALGQLRRDQIIESRRSVLLIRDVPALEALSHV
jgi:CRP/FNR family cyclic AMP-dependent transcriptional regulator